MSPRKANELSAEDKAKLTAAMGLRDEGVAALRQAIREALKASGSVRTVAAFLGISTSTVQKWARESPLTD